ncbi:MAG TPA: hypothetical protein PKE55_01730 [Kiritimatiellia bacterium]|nr:hypothetical protein [Kiritimatiellia bacterium]
MYKTLHYALITTFVALSAHATSINPVNRHGYGANIGWLNFQGDLANGAVIGLYYSTGYVWSANAGWISLGSGTPANGYSYANNTASDWGVNLVMPGGYLRGMAYGANIGWINFETNGNARVDLVTGNLDGYAYGANVGWISLSNSQAFVQTDYLGWGPDSDGDGIPDAYEFKTTGDLTTLGPYPNDADVDGSPDLDEFLADTDPLDGGSVLEITALSRSNPTNHVTWTVQPTRFYRLEQATSATNQAVWTDTGLGILPPGAGPTLTGLVPDPTATTRFYRATAIVPLAP